MFVGWEETPAPHKIVPVSLFCSILVSGFLDQIKLHDSLCRGLGVALRVRETREAISKTRNAGDHDCQHIASNLLCEIGNMPLALDETCKALHSSAGRGA